MLSGGISNVILLFPQELWQWKEEPRCPPQCIYIGLNTIAELVLVLYYSQKYEKYCLEGYLNKREYEKKDHNWEFYSRFQLPEDSEE